MRDVFVLGTSTTPFRRWPQKSHRDLTREAYAAVLEDAGLEPARIEGTWFGSAAMHLFGQANIRGQVALLPLVREGSYPAHAPIVNVEGGCATGALCLYSACLAVASGACDVALALGVEKVFLPDAAKVRELFESGMDQLDPATWHALYTDIAPSCGTAFAPSPDRITILDAVALSASWHMKKYGTTQRALAHVASKNHRHGAHNPNAQYREAMSVEAVLADKGVVYPFTRAMCAPMSDGAAAVLVGSPHAAESLGRGKARVRVAGIGLANGARTTFEEDSVTRVAARRAFARAGISPSAVHVAEVHDATAFAEIAALEDLGFCDRGEGGLLGESGATSLGGRLPVNTSGGLESKGHPLAASGLAMAHELHLQLTGAAGSRQVEGAAWGLAHNAGGLVALDEATSVVTLFERTE